MALPAGSFRGVREEPEWVSWLPLSVGIAGLALVYMLMRGRRATSPTTHGLGHCGCGYRPHAPL